MGMPGSETALEEVMCRVLGPLLQDGFMAKIANDLFCGGNTPHKLLHNGQKVLHDLHQCNLRLSAHKTIICPRSTTILGWIWTAGSLSASPHRLNTLATYPEPTTVARLRSFIGAYKVLSRVIPRRSGYLAPLDAVTAGRPSHECINWTDDLRATFRSAQNALSTALTITLPRPEDKLWIVTDGALRDPGIGSTSHPLLFAKGLATNHVSGRIHENRACNRFMENIVWSKMAPKLEISLLRKAACLLLIFWKFPLNEKRSEHIKKGSESTGTFYSNICDRPDEKDA